MVITPALNAKSAGFKPHRNRIRNSASSGRLRELQRLTLYFPILRQIRHSSSTSHRPLGQRSSTRGSWATFGPSALCIGSMLTDDIYFCEWSKFKHHPFWFTSSKFQFYSLLVDKKRKNKCRDEAINVNLLNCRSSLFRSQTPKLRGHGGNTITEFILNISPQMCPEIKFICNARLSHL